MWIVPPLETLRNNMYRPISSIVILLILRQFPLILPEQFSGSTLTQKWNVGVSTRWISLLPSTADAHAASSVRDVCVAHLQIYSATKETHVVLACRICETVANLMTMNGLHDFTDPLTTEIQRKGWQR